jgi:alkanesulfonate monooxygenase
MTLEFIGQIGVRDYSEIYGDHGGDVGRNEISAAAIVHEQAGFDRVLVATRSTWPDPMIVATYAAALTDRLTFMIAHRPGVVMPTVAARQFATLNQLVGDRVAAHIVVGGEDSEARRDGDHLPKGGRYERASEYVRVMRACWCNEGSLDFAGKYYRICDVRPGFIPASASRITVYAGGASNDAISMAASQADVFALWGESRDDVRELIGRVRDAARAVGRTIRFSVSFRPILAETETLAWERAEQIRQRALAVAQSVNFTRPADPANVGSQRLRRAAERGERLDECMWTGFAAISGATGNSMALVGTPQQVADVIRSYAAMGVSTFILRGFDLCADAALIGRELIAPLRRDSAEHAERAA